MQHILQNLHKNSQPNYTGPLEAEFLIFTLDHPKKIQNFSKFFKGRFFDEILTFGCTKIFWDANLKIRFLEDFCNLVLSVCANFEGCAAKL